MLALEHLRILLNAHPFMPFRLILSDEGAVQVPSPEVVLPSGRFAIIGLLHPNSKDMSFKRWTVVWYPRVTRVEQREPGAPPVSASPGSEASSPSPV